MAEADDSADKKMEKTGSTFMPSGAVPDIPEAADSDEESESDSGSMQSDPEPPPPQYKTRRRSFISQDATSAILEEARQRAEAQAKARQTMLDLADALDEAKEERDRAAERLEQVKKEKQKLKEELKTWPPKLEKVKAEIEVWREKFAMQAMHAKGRTGPLYTIAWWWAWEVRPLGQKRSYTCVASARWQGPEEELDEEEANKVDIITLRHVFNAWAERSPGSTERKEMALRHARELQELQDKIAEMQIELDKKVPVIVQSDEVEPLKALVKELEAKLVAKQEELTSSLRREKVLEDEKLILIQKVDKLQEKHRNEMQGLRDQLEEALNVIKERDAQIAQLEEDLKEARKPPPPVPVAGPDLEKAALKARVKELAHELKQAIGLARHLREVALKAKRDAASCINPEKFSQLVEELEAMKDKLDYLGQQRDNENELVARLKGKLTANSRNLALERQFLPLLHKASGPVGPQNPMLKRKESLFSPKTMLAPGELQEPPGMRGSRSMGAIEGEGSRMASTTGFAGFNKQNADRGGPLRGV
eukprot:TRINITY_DN49485_c0_g1_i1.p1 TRINITY_DN49485_c0_g1~~TRINITY_DN49485_c0_g1_i1.p1  ORF type:complete len:537 (+),score=158.51 TRINITY_DN49485_c0_g1_i1:103-1713(+)